MRRPERALRYNFAEQTAKVSEGCRRKLTLIIKG